jgi:predicted N-acetyltransferase YhbS
LHVSMSRRDIELIPLNGRQLAAAAELARAEHWNQTLRDWETLLQHSPGGSFGALASGQLVGTVTSVSYDRGLAWIGMMLVHREYRGQGIGTRLMRRVLEHLEESGVESVKLDATPAGAPLYRAFGFESQLVIQRWSATNPCSQSLVSTVTTVAAEDPDPELTEFDRDAFGVDRKAILGLLFKNRCCEPARVFDASGKLAGYGLARRGADAIYLGPIVARQSEAAIEILDSLIARVPSGPLYVDYAAHTDDTPLALTQRGFMLQRALSRMGYGKRSAASTARLIYASAGPELG